MPASSPAAAPERATLDPQFLRHFVWVTGAVPFALLAWDALHGSLGPNGVNHAIRTTGELGLIFLVLSLTVTPLRSLAGLTTLIAVRRSLGLYAFAYLVVHFAIFFAFDRAGSLQSTVHEIWMRRYLQIGFAALVLMVPLAVTSTDGMQMRLGAQRWKALHRLAYLIVSLGCIHYALLVKSDLRQPYAFGAATALLLAVRPLLSLREARQRRARTARRIAAEPKAPRRQRFWSGPLRIVQTVQETHDVRTLRLASPDGGPLPFSFMAGQYLNLALTIGGKTVRRSYTIASSATQTAYCEISVKRAADGYASWHVHDALAEGHLLQVSAPAGQFVFDGSRGDAVTLIGGGVGITPLMSIVRTLTDRTWKGRIEMVLAMRTAKDLVFARELEALQARFSNLHVTVTLSQETGPGWTGRRGVLTREALADILGPKPAGPIYLCGPEPMMVAVRASLRELGVPDEAILTEAFVSPPSPTPAEATSATDDADAGMPDSTPQPMPATGDGAGHDARFARRKLVVMVPGAQTLLEAAEDAGVDLPFECRSGICGQCKVRLLEGQVSMDVKDALSPAERGRGIVLACQAKALTDLVVDA